MSRPCDFEVTLLQVTSCGDLVFSHLGAEQNLIAEQGSIGAIPTVPADVAAWAALVGRTGKLTIAWYPSTERPALFSFMPYANPTLRRATVLDDAGSNPALIGWRDYDQPYGFLASVYQDGRGA
ncbi:hypothetical protein [Stutzerimonas stutzeri]|jgi:hypothetical protein|uniref:hypothetical protein n=1 Tax=Stutzerimonas stutzeri TaxID=316 RepID=UPI003713CEDC|tara:strand:- start:44026 stop:44397 length:372 start_codon:yes stop_codon:yes gene_type:complete